MTKVPSDADQSEERHAEAGGSEMVRMRAMLKETPQRWQATCFEKSCQFSAHAGVLEWWDVPLSNL